MNLNSIRRYGVLANRLATISQLHVRTTAVGSPRISRTPLSSTLEDKHLACNAYAHVFQKSSLLPLTDSEKKYLGNKAYNSSGSYSRRLLCDFRCSHFSNKIGETNNFDLLNISKINLVDSYSKSYIHTSSLVSKKEESRVEETLEAIKESVKQKEAASATKVEPVVIPKDVHAEKKVSTEATTVSTVGPKKSIWHKIVAEVKHYYHGFRLLFIDIRVCSRLVWRVLNGKQLTRREQKQLVRTTADMFRIVPFSVFIIVPFAEILLPFAIRLFPGMLPSTFQEADKQKEKQRKILKGKIEMAKFLQDTIEETALRRKGGSDDSVQTFSNFLNKIRESGAQTSNDEILKFSKLFEDEITLDNLTYNQLNALCKLLEIPPVGPSSVLRFQLELRLRQLEADDKMIQKEGIDSMEVWELQDACRARGMRSVGFPEERLKTQLSQWLDLHLNSKVPTSLLLLSRTLYLPEHMTAEEQLKATISTLPEATGEEAKVKISEVLGDRVDNRSKLEIIKQEEAIIRKEKLEEERIKKEENEKKAKEEAAATAETMKLEPELVDKAKVLQPSATEILGGSVGSEDILQAVKEIKQLETRDKENEIDSRDLRAVEEVLERVAETKLEMNPTEEDLKALKEDVTVYNESLDDLRQVVKDGGIEMKESKSAELLRKRVNNMIEQMELALGKMSEKTETLMGDIQKIEKKIETSPNEDVKPLPLPTEQLKKDLVQEKKYFITIVELLQSIKSAPDAEKLEQIVKVIDEDEDGVIDVKNALKVIELLGKEHMKMNTDQLPHIMEMLRRESELKEGKKAKKQQQEKNAASQQAKTPANGDTVNKTEPLNSLVINNEDIKKDSMGKIISPPPDKLSEVTKAKEAPKQL